MNSSADKNPLVSAVVFAYRNLDEFEYTVQSILGQDYPEIELLISDDGSPDFAQHKAQIVNYIEQNKKDNLKSYEVYTLAKNGGSVKNFNQGIRRAKGEYVVGVAMGDRYADGTVFSTYVHALRTSGKRMAVSRSRLVTQEYEFLDEVRPDDAMQKKLEKMTAQQLFCLTLSTEVIKPVGMCFEKALFEEVGPVDERIRLIEDLPWTLAVTKNGYAPCFIDRVMTHYVVGGISGKMTYNPAFYDDLRTAIEVSRVPVDHRYGAMQAVYNWLHMHRYVDYAQAYRREKVLGKNPLKRLTAMAKLGAVACALKLFPVYVQAKKD